MTFKVIQREINTWNQDETGKITPVIVWNCGHEHRSIRAATKCLDKLNGTTRSVGAEIRDADGNEISPEWY